MSTDQEQRKEVGVAEVQQIVAELMQLKRDLRHWRSYTKDSTHS